MEKSALFEKLVFEECEGGITLIDFKEEYRNEVEELVYDEYFDSMGDDNHNVYEGALILKKI